MGLKGILYRKLLKKVEKDQSLPLEVGVKPSIIQTPPTNQNLTITKQHDDKKGTGVVKMRNYQQIDTIILDILRKCPSSVPTHYIATTIGTNFTSCKHHMERLAFDGFIERFQQGKDKRWNYWRIKR